MKKIVTMGADFTLEQTKEACEKIQEGDFQLESISTTTVEENHVNVSKNKAVFRGEFSNKILNELTFIKVGNDDPEVITKKMKGEGRTPISDSDIFVEKTLAKVLVFGKIS